MVVIWIVLGILVLGLVIGLIQRPKALARSRQRVDAIQAMATNFGWRIERSAPPNFIQRLPLVTSVLVNDTGYHRITTNVHLVGQWRGVPIVALQLAYATDNVATYTLRSATMLMIPRPIPGPTAVLTPQGHSWVNFLKTDEKIGYPAFDDRFHLQARNSDIARQTITPSVAHLLAADPRAEGLALFFGEQDLAATFPGHINQAQVVAATADLLVDLSHQMSSR